MSLLLKLFHLVFIKIHLANYYERLYSSYDQLFNFDITGHAYRQDKLIIGIYTERNLEVGFTGLTNCAGDMMTVMFTKRRRYNR